MFARLRGTGATLLAACALALGGCGGSDTEIIATLAADGEPVRIGSEDIVASPSIGLVGDDVLVSWTVAGDSTAPPSMPFRLRAVWSDRAGGLRSEVQDVGPTMGLHQQWVGLDGRLHAQLWGDPLERGEPPESERVFVLSARPGGLVESAQVQMHLAPPPDECPACAQLLIGTYSSAGPIGLPIVALDDRVVGGLIAMPSQADCSGLTNYKRLHLFDERSFVGAASTWGEPICDPDPIRASALEVEQPFLLRLSSGDLGVLLRWHGTGEPYYDVYFVPLDRDTLQPTGGPVRVGRNAGSGPGDGYQPQGAATGGSIVLTERSSRGDNGCHLLRVANEDGSGAHDAPWQLPCEREGHDRWVTYRPSLTTVPGGVLLVWDQRTGPRLLPSVSSVPDYEEGIYAVVLTRDGRRGSEVIEVTAPTNTLVWMDRPAQYRPAVSVDGDRIAIAWRDLQPGAPGMYLRMLRVAELSAADGGVAE